MVNHPEVGKTYWVTSRERVRSGRGVRAVTVTEVVYATSCYGHRGPTGVQLKGGSYVGLSNLYDNEAEAAAAAILLINNEIALERARFMQIMGRLGSAKDKIRASE